MKVLTGIFAALWLLFYLAALGAISFLIFKAVYWALFVWNW